MTSKRPPSHIRTSYDDTYNGDMTGTHVRPTAVCTVQVDAHQKEGKHFMIATAFPDRGSDYKIVLGSAIGALNVREFIIIDIPGCFIVSHEPDMIIIARRERERS